MVLGVRLPTFENTTYETPMSLESKITLKEKSVCLYFRRIYYYTGLVLNDSSEWSAKYSNFTTKRPNHQEDKEKLQELKNTYDNLITEAINSGFKEGSEVKRYIDNHFKKVSLNLSNEVIEGDLITGYSYNKFWNSLKASSSKFSLRTEQKYKTHQGVIEEFCKHYDKHLLLQIDYEFVLAYRMWLTVEQTRIVEGIHGKRTIKVLGLRNKTLKKYMSNLNQFLRWCEGEYNIQFDKRIYKIKTSAEQFTKKQNAGLALTPEMYDELKDYEPKHMNEDQNEAERKTRDYVVFLCNTGLRWSDFETLSKSDFVKKGGDVYIRKIMQKTTEHVQIKLNKTAREIAEKYNFNFREVVKSNAKTNQTIKNILKQLPSCRIKKKIIKEWINNKTEDEDWFYNLFSLHKCRHTFVSRLLRAGANPASIQKATGWSKIEMLNIYTDLESASDDNTLDLLD